MRETVTRSLSGLVYIILLTVSIFYSQFSFLILFGVFLLIAVCEFCNLVKLQKPIPFAIAIFAYTLFGFFPVSPITAVLLLGGTLFVSVKCMLFLYNDSRQHFDVGSKYVFLLGYIILPFVLLTRIPFLNGMYPIYRPEIIISIFVIIWTNDTFAFIVGKTIGQTKLFEKISPKKTVEGFIGGAGFGILAASLIAWYYIKEPVFIWIFTAIILTVGGTIGDLIQSKFKRLAKVKHSGAIMPGHGGILDRLDSIIFAAPFVFLFYQILYYVS